MLHMMDRHFYRPAHIHLLVSTFSKHLPQGASRANHYIQVRREGHKELVTQIFDKNCPYLGNDTVFAVKDELAVDFVPRKDDPKAQFELEYNVTLAPTK